MLAVGHLLLAFAISTGVIAAQDRGALLVATGASRDADFTQTVVLILDHDAHKTTGLVLNRPVRISLAEIFPGLTTRQTAWAGGPVLLGVNALLRTKTPPADADRVLRSVYLITDKPTLRHTVAAGISSDSFRVYLGVCGWGAGQLESEIHRRLWHILPGSADLVFDEAPVTLWKRLSQRPRELDTFQAPYETRQ